MVRAGSLEILNMYVEMICIPNYKKEKTAKTSKIRFEKSLTHLNIEATWMRKICENHAVRFVVRFVDMRGATAQYFSPMLPISAGIRWETTSWILTSQETAGIHDPGLRITPGSDPDPGMILGLARPLAPRQAGLG